MTNEEKLTSTIDSSGHQDQTWVGWPQGGDFAYGDNYYFWIAGYSFSFRVLLIPNILFFLQLYILWIWDNWFQRQGVFRQRKSIQWTEKEFSVCTSSKKVPYGYQSGGRGVGEVWERYSGRLGLTYNTITYKYIINKDLLYNMGNSTQFSVIIYMGK